MKKSFLFSALLSTAIALGIATAPAFAMDDMKKKDAMHDSMKKKDSMKKDKKMMKKDSMKKKDKM